MNRREVLKTLAVASGGLVALPSWAIGWSSKQVTDSSSVFTSLETSLIRATADTFIPEENSVGALPVGVDQFLISLISRCYDQDVQQNVKNQLNRMNELAQAEYEKEFIDCSQMEREFLLLTFEKSDNGDQSDFYNLMKSETIRGFQTSQVVMENYLNYQLMPGYYDGCADVKT